MDNFIYGLIAGSLGAFFVYPIDVIKTRMQNKNIYSNEFDCFIKIYKNEGFKSFYKGCIPQLFGVANEKAVKLVTYNYITKYNNDKFIYHFYGGICAGFMQVLISCPYEMIKINLQMNNSIYNISPKQLYTGIIPCFLRDIPFSAIYFPIYWFCKDNLNYNPIIAGTLAGIPSAFLCTPADFIKTRMQTLKNNNMFSLIKNIYYNEGFMTFWKGSRLRVIRTGPQFGITLYIYELLK